MLRRSGVRAGAAVVESIRRWSPAPIHTLVYTHGHADHVGGSGAFAADARARGDERPRVISHANVNARLARYELTNDWNLIINTRQFGGVRSEMNLGIGGRTRRFLPADTHAGRDVRAPTRRADRRRARRTAPRPGRDRRPSVGLAPRPTVGDGRRLRHLELPHAGNPQKVQRYPVEWAAALRQMIDAVPSSSCRPRPADRRPGAHRNGARRHGRRARDLVADTLAMMNAGATLRHDHPLGVGRRRCSSGSPTSARSTTSPSSSSATSGGSTAAGRTASRPG